jgi:hypothetical protein
LSSRAQGLIHQHQLRIEDQGAGECHALLLAAGKLRRPALAHLRQLDHAEGALDLRLDLGLRHLPHLQRKGEVLLDRHMREQRIILKHHADIALVRRDMVDRLAVEEDAAMGRHFEPGQHHQGGGLARAGGAKQRQELAGADLEIEVFDDQGFAVIGLLHARRTERSPL